MSKEASGQPYKKVYGKPEMGNNGFDEVHMSHYTHELFGNKKDYDEHIMQSGLNR